MQKISTSTGLLAFACATLGELFSNLVNLGGASKQEAQCIQDELTSMTSTAAMQKNDIWDKDKTDANNITGWRSRRATIYHSFMCALTQPARDISGFAIGRRGGSSVNPIVAQIIEIAKEANRTARTTLGVGTRKIAFSSMRGFNKEWTNQFKKDLSALKKSGVKLPDTVTNLCAEHLDLYEESVILAFELKKALQQAAKDADTKTRKTMDILKPKIHIHQLISDEYNKGVTENFTESLDKLRNKHPNMASNEDLIEKYLVIYEQPTADVQTPDIVDAVDEDTVEDTVEEGTFVVEIAEPVEDTVEV